MRQVFFHKGNVFVKQVPFPLLEDNNILVRVHYSFISSGTEVATLNLSRKSMLCKFGSDARGNVKKIIGAVRADGISGTIALIKEKIKSLNSLGYSCSGQVVKIGKKVEKFRVGDYVACAGAGVANHADFVTVPVNLAAKVADKSILKQASLTTIGAVAMQGVRRAEISLGEKVCVLGLGLIGQITVQLAKLSGCQVFGIDLQQDRLKLSKKLGADFVFNSSQVDVEKEIDFLTNHNGVDVTIITAASNSGKVIDQAMRLTRKKGKVVLVGDVKLDFSRDQFYSKEIDFLISCSYGPGRYDVSFERDGAQYPYPYVRWTQTRNMELFVNLIKSGKILIDPLIFEKFNVEEVGKAYDSLKKSKALGVVLFYFDDGKDDYLKDIDELLKEGGSYIRRQGFIKEKDEKVLPYIKPQGKLNVGIVGVGGFAKIKLLPSLSKNKNVDIHSIIDTNSANLINIAGLYNAKKIGNICNKMFADDDVNLVVISTPHSYHFEQTMNALKNGKAVFVEKPAVISFEQLDKLNKFFKENKNSVYCVDFNRSFAPFNLIIKNELEKRKNPALIHYRMNSGFISKDHWIQDERNGGRIIGEACHIFELFCFLTGAKPITISVESLNHGSDDLLSNDNFIVSLRMDDGSCCSLIYTSIGSSQMEKERMEVFFDGKSIIMEDYKILKGFGFPLCFNKITRLQDKGHENLLSLFIKSAKTQGEKLPIPFDRIFIATKLSLIADKLARKGGGFELFENCTQHESYDKVSNEFFVQKRV